MLLDPIFILYSLSISEGSDQHSSKSFLLDQRYYLLHTSGQLSLSRCAMHTLPFCHYPTTIPSFSPLER